VCVVYDAHLATAPQHIPLRPRGHWDRLKNGVLRKILGLTKDVAVERCILFSVLHQLALE